MEATFLHDGRTIDYTPSSDVAAGEVVVLGKVCMAAVRPIPANTTGSLAATGVFEFDKESGLAISFGDALYWDAAAKKATKTATGNVYLGVCAADAGASDEKVRGMLRSLQEAVSGQLGLADLADVASATPTAGNILVGDGTDFQSVANDRAHMVQEDLRPYPIPLTDAKVWDAPSTPLGATPANDDLGVIDNTFLTGAPTIETGDLKNAGATTRKCRFRVPVPANYVAGETLTLRVNAGMKTTVASASATVDAQVAESGDPTTDICATNAQSINSLDAADKDFTLTPTNVAPGDVLDVVLSVAVNDSGTGTAVIGKINSVSLLADTKG